MPSIALIPDFFLYASFIIISLFVSLFPSTAWAGEDLKGRRSQLAIWWWAFHSYDWILGSFAKARLWIMSFTALFEWDGDDQDNREGNLGIDTGKSYPCPFGQRCGGCGGWLDRRITERGSHFHQVTTGVKWLGKILIYVWTDTCRLSWKNVFDSQCQPSGPTLVGTGI